MDPTITVRVGACEPGGKPGVDRGEQDEHHGAADVHPPVGHRPVDLSTVVAQLVGLPIACVIDGLGNAGHEDRGALAQPPIEARARHLRLAADLGDRPPKLRVGDDHEPLALAEAGAGGSLGDRRDSLQDGSIDRLVGKMTDHPAPPDDLLEFHRSSSGYAVLVRQ